MKRICKLIMRKESRVQSKKSRVRNYESRVKSQESRAQGPLDDGIVKQPSSLLVLGDSCYLPHRQPGSQLLVYTLSWPDPPGAVINPALHTVHYTLYNIHYIL